jgi:UDP-glucose 4-epimerase
MTTKDCECPEGSGAEAAILITGISGALGRLLTRRLAETEQIIGICRRPFHGKPRAVQVHQVDLRKRRAEQIFRCNRIKAVVHLGLIRNPRISDRHRHEYNLGTTRALFDYVARYDVPKLVLLSTANAYGAHPDNPTLITEDAPLSGDRGFPEIRDQIALDMYAQSFLWKNPDTETVILRPVNILGPTVRNAASNYLRAPVVPVVMGFDPMIQVIHEEDVVEAIRLAMKPGIRGIFNIVGPGEVPLRTILKILKRRTIPVPNFLLRPFTFAHWEFTHTMFQPQEWDYIKYPCIVDGSEARRVLGFEPAYTLMETITSILT